MSTESVNAVGRRQLGHRSMEQEVRIDSLPVRGEFPRWLTGSFLRATPAKLDIGDRSVGHWFDGLGMLNVFGFDDGRVSYANRFFDTNAYRQAQRGRYDAAVSIGTDPCRHLGQRLMALFDPTLIGEPHVNIGKLGERYFGATETPCPLEFDPQTLETIGFVDLGHSKRDVHMTYSHPQFDAKPGQMTTVVTRLGVRNEHRIETVDRDFRRRKVGAAPAGRRPEYMHSFAMTEHYVVLPLQPMTYSMPAILRTGRYNDGFRWNPDNGTTFVVIDRRTGRVHSRHRTEAFFYWHTINAYEDSDHVVVDLVTAPSPRSVWDLELPRLRDPAFRPQFFGHPHRYRLPLNGGPIEREQLSEVRMEFPRINDRHATLPYRHAYAIAYRGADSDWFDQIIKLDTTTGNLHHWYQDDCYPSEPVFVPTPDSAGEDDGVILDVVLDTRAGASFMLALDARDLSEIARAELPHHLPFNFHQQYYG